MYKRQVVKIPRVKSSKKLKVIIIIIIITLFIISTFVTFIPCNTNDAVAAVKIYAMLNAESQICGCTFCSALRCLTIFRHVLYSVAKCFVSIFIRHLLRLHAYGCDEMDILYLSSDTLYAVAVYMYALIVYSPRTITYLESALPFCLLRVAGDALQLISYSS